MSMYQFATAGMQAAGYTGDFESTAARAFNQIMNAEIATMHMASAVSLASFEAPSTGTNNYAAGFSISDVRTV